MDLLQSHNDNRPLSASVSRQSIHSRQIPAAFTTPRHNAKSTNRLSMVAIANNSTARNGKVKIDNSPLYSQENREIWSALGAYICKEMLNGRGVVIPKLGHFTFTAAEIDLMGTTNPHVRDKQYRTPVFMVGKDFV